MIVGEVEIFRVKVYCSVFRGRDREASWRKAQSMLYSGGESGHLTAADEGVGSAPLILGVCRSGTLGANDEFIGSGKIIILLFT